MSSGCSVTSGVNLTTMSNFVTNHTWVATILSASLTRAGNHGWPGVLAQTRSPTCTAGTVLSSLLTPQPPRLFTASHVQQTHTHRTQHSSFQQMAESLSSNIHLIYCTIIYLWLITALGHHHHHHHHHPRISSWCKSWNKTSGTSRQWESNCQTISQGNCDHVTIQYTTWCTSMCKGSYGEIGEA